MASAIAACSTQTGGDANDAPPTNATGAGGAPGDGGTAANFVPGSDAAADVPAAASCATGKSVVTREPLYVEIILDGSRSMDGHGGPTASVPCDLTADTDVGPDDCFLSGAREPDPLAPTRDELVCHQEANSDTAGAAATNCPGFIGLTGKKWLAARGAIAAYVDGLAASPGAKLGLGLFLFSSTNEANPQSWDVPIAMVDASHAAALKGRVAPGTWPAGGTPLKTTLEGQASLLASYAPTAPLEAGGQRVMILMTDGVPNGSSTKQEVIDVVQAAANGTPSIKTIIVGIGDPSANEDTVYDEKFLSRLASAGGAAPAGCNPNWDGENPNGTTPCHLQVTPGTKTAAQIQADLAPATDAIARSVSCEFTLDQTATIDPTHVNVVLDNGAGSTSQIASDPQNGWTYDDPAAPTKVVLHGSACEALKSDAGASIQIVIGCKTGEPIR